MIRWLNLFRLKCKAYVLQEQAVHAEGLIADHERRYELCILELRKIKSRIATLERPEVLLSQAIRRSR